MRPLLEIVDTLSSLNQLRMNATGEGWRAVGFDYPEFASAVAVTTQPCGEGLPPPPAQVICFTLLQVGLADSCNFEADSELIAAMPSVVEMGVRPTLSVLSSVERYWRSCIQDMEWPTAQGVARGFPELPTLDRVPAAVGRIQDCLAHARALESVASPEPWVAHVHRSEAHSQYRTIDSEPATGQGCTVCVTAAGRSVIDNGLEEENTEFICSMRNGLRELLSDVWALLEELVIVTEIFRAPGSSLVNSVSDLLGRAARSGGDDLVGHFVSRLD